MSIWEKLGGAVSETPEEVVRRSWRELGFSSEAAAVEALLTGPPAAPGTAGDPFGVRAALSGIGITQPILIAGGRAPVGVAEAGGEAAGAGFKTILASLGIPLAGQVIPQELGGGGILESGDQAKPWYNLLSEILGPFAGLIFIALLLYIKDKVKFLDEEEESQSRRHH